MRLCSLNLLRYGHFTNSSVAFPTGGSDFHMVFGPNEAGKSTAMCAIEDLIFGIPGNSTRNFLHDYGAMRIGAEIESDGNVLSLRRRKGNKDTLLTVDDNPLPAGDGALAPFLGRVDRVFFARMFCLDHERLRKGGRDILEAKDDVGQMLFSAGSGVAGLRDHLTAMQTEADSLWASRRASHRRYYQAEERLKAADIALREHTVTSANWHDLKIAYEKASEACENLEKEIETHAIELRKLTRIRRVYRNVRRRAEVETEISSLGTVLPLPADASMLVENAASDDSAATTRITTLTEQIDSLRAAREGLTIDEALLQREPDIELLHERRIQIRASKADLPKRRAELIAAEATLKRAATELEWTGDNIDEIIERIPSRAKVTAVRALLTRRSGQLAAITSAASAVEDAEENIQELTTQLERTGTALDVSKLAAVIKATRELGDLDGRIAAADRGVEEAKSLCERRLSTMVPQSADEASLLSMPVPSVDTIRAHRDADRDLERRIQAAEERIRAAEQAIIRDKKAYERIVSAEQIVSADDLSLLRKRRDAGWSIIRREHIEGIAVPAAELAAFGAEGELANAYETVVQAADQAADQRFEKAETTASAMVLAQQIDEQQDGLDSLNAELTALSEEKNALVLAWANIWSHASLTPSAPDQMLDWLSCRTNVLELIERRDTAIRLMASLRGEEHMATEQVCAQLSALGIEASYKDLPLRALLVSADAIQRREESSEQNRRGLNDALIKARADIERKRKLLQKAQDDNQSWQTEWTAAVTSLGLLSASASETIQTQVNAIDEMRESAVKINDLKYERIGKIERDITAFENDVRQLVTAVAPTFVEHEPENAILELEVLLKKEVGMRNLAAEKETTLASLQKKADVCELSRREAQDVIKKLQTAARVDTLDQLRDAIAKAERQRVLQSEFEMLSTGLVEDGDGLTIDLLAEECADIDIDQVSAREQTLDQQLADLRKRLMEAGDTRSSARRDFDGIGGADTAARDAADRQAAITEIHDIAGQYVRVRSAATLLQWSIDRFRREKQAPILKRAGELFSILTDGSFETLQLEFDDNDSAHLAGIRRDGERVKVPGLSTGVGDQLYLALRIAAVEEYLAHAAPLPFVADDLFINYDDERAAAGFRVLAHLAKKTQVLFFTHHHHLIDVAKSALGGAVSAVTLAPRMPKDREFQQEERRLAASTA
jgi:uncharacterized protein YhaN